MALEKETQIPLRGVTLKDIWKNIEGVNHTMKVMQGHLNSTRDQLTSINGEMSSMEGRVTKLRSSYTPCIQLPKPTFKYH